MIGLRSTKFRLGNWILFVVFIRQSVIKTMFRFIAVMLKCTNLYEIYLCRD